jgi:hypothetical protein
MSLTTPAISREHPHLTCHLGMHDWMKIRDDEWHIHFKCRHCDHIKADNSAWWDFASGAGTAFH